jgi:hypothetical protein
MEHIGNGACWHGACWHMEHIGMMVRNIIAHHHARLNLLPVSRLMLRGRLVACHSPGSAHRATTLQRPPVHTLKRGHLTYERVIKATPCVFLQADLVLRSGAEPASGASQIPI